MSVLDPGGQIGTHQVGQKTFSAEANGGGGEIIRDVKVHGTLAVAIVEAGKVTWS